MATNIKPHRKTLHGLKCAVRWHEIRLESLERRRAKKCENIAQSKYRGSVFAYEQIDFEYNEDSTPLKKRLEVLQKELAERILLDPNLDKPARNKNVVKN